MFLLTAHNVDIVGPYSEGERHLQPPDTFPVLKRTKKLQKHFWSAQRE